jgi:hypothetical protein
MRRFTHLTNCFSKKVENRRAAVARLFGHYNFVRLHSTIGCTPDMAARVSRHLWSLEALVDQGPRRTWGKVSRPVREKGSKLAH